MDGQEIDVERCLISNIRLHLKKKCIVHTHTEEKRQKNNDNNDEILYTVLYQHLMVYSVLRSAENFSISKKK